MQNKEPILISSSNENVNSLTPDFYARPQTTAAPLSIFSKQQSITQPMPPPMQFIPPAPPPPQVPQSQSVIVSPEPKKQRYLQDVTFGSQQAKQPQEPLTPSLVFDSAQIHPFVLNDVTNKSEEENTNDQRQFLKLGGGKQHSSSVETAVIENEEQQSVQTQEESEEKKTPVPFQIYIQPQVVLLDLIENMEVQEKNSVSKSIVLFGNLSAYSQTIIEKSHSQQSKYPQGTKVAIKLSVGSTPKNNSLEIERAIYMTIARAIQYITPHMLPGIYEGECSDIFLRTKASTGGMTPNETKFFDEWIKLRAQAIWNSFSKTERAHYQNVYKRFMQTNTFDLVSAFNLFSKEWADKFSIIHYIVLPQLKGKKLETLLEEGTSGYSAQRKQHTTSNFALLIAMQVAQALAAARLIGMQHNDLHSGNIFVEYVETPQLVPYTYPAPYNLYTHYVVHIYDFDHAATFLHHNRFIDQFLCRASGECNEFRQGYDWYKFLVGFLNRLQRTQFQPYKNLLALTLTEEALKKAQLVRFQKSQKMGMDAFFGRPCTCTRTNADGTLCLKCTPRDLTTSGEILMSPEDFFQEMKQQFPTGIF